jgi:hypothetical protein
MTIQFRHGKEAERDMFPPLPSPPLVGSTPDARRLVSFSLLSWSSSPSASSTPLPGVASPEPAAGLPSSLGKD